MGRKNKRREFSELNKDEIKEIIRKHSGIILNIAEELGLSYSTCYRMLTENDEYMDIIREEQEKLLDRSENLIYKKIKAGDLTTVKWFLQMKGGKRGYGNNQNIAITDANNIVKIEFIDKKGDKQ